MKTYARRLAVSGPVWLLFATIGLGQMYISFRARDYRPSPFPLDILAANYLYWWLATPIVMYLIHRFPFDGSRWRTAVAVHLPAALVFALFPELIRVGTAYLIRNPAQRWDVLWLYRAQLGNRYGFEVTTYIAIGAVVATLELLQRSRDREMHAARLEAELARSRLQALTAQLHPHFLFNALNSVAMLIRDGAHDGALRTVIAYGDLLRGVLSPVAKEIPLRDEMAFVNRYLEIERTRFPDILAATVDIPRELEEALVPSFVLQPIVENALHHAFSGLEPARLSVSVERRNGTLRLEVADNGRGLPADWSVERSSGLGLRNTRARLAEYYGDAQRFELKSAPGQGTRVVLEIPLRLTAAAEMAIP